MLSLSLSQLRLLEIKVENGSAFWDQPTVQCMLPFMSMDSMSSKNSTMKEVWTILNTSNQSKDLEGHISCLARKIISRTVLYASCYSLQRQPILHFLFQSRAEINAIIKHSSLPISMLLNFTMLICQNPKWFCVKINYKFKIIWLHLGTFFSCLTRNQKWFSVKIHKFRIIKLHLDARRVFWW